MIIALYLLWKPNTWLCGAFQYCPNKCSNWNTYTSVMTRNCWTTVMNSTKHKYSIAEWIHMWCQNVRSHIHYGKQGRVGTNAITALKFHNDWPLMATCSDSRTGAMGRDLHGFKLDYCTFWNLGTVRVHLHWRTCRSKIPERPAGDIGMWSRRSEDGQQHYFICTGANYYFTESSRENLLEYLHRKHFMTVNTNCLFPIFTLQIHLQKTTSTCIH